MRINRYTRGRSNVSLLREQQQRSMSPEQAGAAAAAPYNAVSDITGQAADALQVYEAKRKKAAAEGAAIDAQTQTTMMANAIDNLPLEAEANQWTPEQMRENGLQTLKTYDDSLNAISPEFREELRPAWQTNKAMYAQQIANMTLQYEDKTNRAKMGASWVAAVEARDPIQMKMIRDLTVEMKYSDPEKTAKMDAQINVVSKENEIEDIYQAWQMSDNRDSIYAEIVNDQSMDKDVKDSVIKQIEGQINNEKSLDTQRTRQAAIVYERQVTDLSVRAKKGEDITGLIEPLIAEMDSFGSPTLSDKASGWRNTLYLATTKGLTKKVNDITIGNKLALGPGSMVGDTPNRKELQDYANSMLPENATSEDRIALENSLTKLAGFPTHDVHQELKAAAAGYNAVPLVRAATRLLEITNADPYTGIDLGLEGKEIANLMSVVNGITSGLDPMEVATEVVENNKKWRDNNVVTTELSKQAGTTNTEEWFDDLFGNAYDDLNWLPGGQADVIPPEETQARIRYQQYFEQAYVRNGGDEEGAKLAADMRFQQTHALTYINGKPELQFGGIRAGSKELGDTLFESDLKGMAVIGLDETDSFVMTVENRDDVTFQNPKIVNGKQHYQVYVNDRPAFSFDKNDTRQSIYVVVDEDAELAVQGAKDAEQIKDIRSKITKLESEMRRIERTGTDRTDENMPQYRESTTARERDIPKEIELLQSQIRSLQ